MRLLALILKKPVLFLEKHIISMTVKIAFNFAEIGEIEKANEALTVLSNGKHRLIIVEEK